MRHKYEEVVEIPSGITCEMKDYDFICKKGGTELKKRFSLLKSEVEIHGNQIKFVCKKANKTNIANIKAHIAHVHNLFRGLEEKYVYELEIANVHFPMTVKVEGSKVVIGNFLGEKVNRKASIVAGSEVEIKGQKVIVSSHDKESAGQTAANIEKASKVPNKDRRVFQDGIFIISKPGRDA